MSRATPIERRLLKQVGRAIEDFGLVAEGDRIAVALSGGKDSYGLMHLLGLLRGRAPVRFDLVALHLDQGQPGYDGTPLLRWLEAREIPHHVVRRDTYSVVVEKIAPGGTYCSMCSRMRRGILYDACLDLGCNKLALGHHRDDTIETLMLNLVFSGQLKAMPPKLVSDDGRNVVIRPLVYAAEEDLAALAAEQGFPILPCNLCGSQPNMQRQAIKAMLGDLQRLHPDLKRSMLAALGNVRPSHLLDPKIWRGLGLPVAREEPGDRDRGLGLADWAGASMAPEGAADPGGEPPARGRLPVLGEGW